MGSYAASGGYYIATNSKKIFADSTTLTGSIGVFLVKFDASNWAKSYGIRSDYHPYGSHSAAAHPLTPLTPGMKENFERLSLSFYDYFKKIVSDARSLSVDEVEKIAQGRVWTGEQAKEVGLIGESTQRHMNDNLYSAIQYSYLRYCFQMNSEAWIVPSHMQSLHILKVKL